MTTRAESYAGVSVAMVTPFLNNKIDFHRLEEQIEFLVNAGVSSLVPVGTTGESPTLTHEEHQQVIEAVVKINAGRTKVMAGTGSNCTEEAISLTRFAQKAGADSALIVAPYYNKPTQEGFYQHFKAIAQAVDLPICVYNIPGRTGKKIEPETIIRLAEISTIQMVKEATGSMDQASQIISATDLTVLSGDDSLTLPFMSIGAKGVVSVVANIIPQDLIAFCNAALSGDYESARVWHHKLFPLCRDMLSLSTNPIPIKAAMKILGRDTGELRLPMTPLEPVLMEKLSETLKNYGILR